VIVEFVGAPGAGKSTVSHALCERLRREGRSVSEPSFELAREPGSPGFRQLRRATRFFLREPALSLRWVSLVFRSRQTTAKRGVSRALDLLTGCCLARESIGRSELQVFDQGVFQSVASTGYSARAPLDANAWSAALGRTHPPSRPVVVIFVRASVDVLLQRLLDRRDGRSVVDRIESPAERARAISEFAAAVDEVERLVKRLGDRTGARFHVWTVGNDVADSGGVLADELCERLRGVLPLS
jgi:thymidylate kinase